MAHLYTLHLLLWELKKQELENLCGEMAFTQPRTRVVEKYERNFHESDHFLQTSFCVILSICNKCNIFFHLIKNRKKIPFEIYVWCW